jgi:hypothetical protein
MRDEKKQYLSDIIMALYYHRWNALSFDTEVTHPSVFSAGDISNGKSGASQLYIDSGLADKTQQITSQQSDLIHLSATSTYNICTLIMATCFGFYQPSSGLCLPYGGTSSMYIHYGIPQCLHKIITVIKV